MTSQPAGSGTIAGSRLPADPADLSLVMGGQAPADEPFVGSGDIQSLADLGNSFEVVKSMRIVPVTKEAILQLGIVF